MRQGAVGHVRLVERHGRTLVEKRMTDASRHDTEILALVTLTHSRLPVPEVAEARAGSILRSDRVPGTVHDGADELVIRLSADR